MRVIDFPVEFKSDWSNIEIEGVIAIVKNYSYQEGDIFGDTTSHVYSSQSGYAMLGYQDLNIAHDDFGAMEINHIAITTGENLILVCEYEDTNDETHEAFIELEPNDFI